MCEHILSLSYGKDSLACLGAIQQLGWPLDRIVHVEVWATDTIPADFPPVMDFKKRADIIIKEQFGIEVEHIRASKTYEDCFYSAFGKQGRKSNEKRSGCIYGWPYQCGPWCNSRLKQNVLNGALKGCKQYIGISSDEPKRFHVLSDTKQSPLLAAGWTQHKNREWCEKNDLLLPTYTVSARSGCWFCHNQSVNQLRILRKNYPEYWALMLKWDKDSPVSFKPDGHTLHDFEQRFLLEDEHLICKTEHFCWSMLDAELNYRLF